MARKNVLVTGMSGLIGSAVHRILGDKHAFRALNRRDVPGVPCHRADITDLGAIQPAFAGIDTVVHLAAALPTPDTTVEDLVRHNVVGTYNVFEAARRAGVKRVIYASSGATMSGWEHEAPYGALVEGRYDEVSPNWEKVTHRTPTWPSGIYGCTKVWGEALARHFTDTSDLSILCLRIGAVGKEDRPQGARGFSIWCSQRDIVQMIDHCIEAPPGLKYDIFFVLSNNRWGYRDLEHARELLGYVPQDSAEEYR
jgi:nucleoside-diphosphate-sugar epimerase